MNRRREYYMDTYTGDVVMRYAESGVFVPVVKRKGGESMQIYKRASFWEYAIENRMGSVLKWLNKDRLGNLVIDTNGRWWYELIGQSTTMPKYVFKAIYTYLKLENPRIKYLFED